MDDNTYEAIILDLEQTVAAQTQTIARLHAKIADLREALYPFATFARHYARHKPSEAVNTYTFKPANEKPTKEHLTVGDLHKAHSAYGPLELGRT